MTQAELVAARTPFPIVSGVVGWIKRNGLVAPAIIFAVVVTQAPFALTIWFSLQKWNLLRPENSRFNGLGNYIDILTRGDFISALIVTVILTFSSVAAALIIGIGLAELVNQRFPGRNIVRTLLITPFLVMPVVAALGWKTTLLNPVFGIVDWLMTSVGLPRIDWFAEYPLIGIITIITARPASTDGPSTPHRK